MQLKNAELTVHLHEVRSQVRELQANGIHKLNQIIRMQGEIKCDMMDIRSNMMFLSDNVSGLISSTMDAVLEKLKEKKSDGKSDVVEEQPQEKVSRGFELCTNIS